MNSIGIITGIVVWLFVDIYLGIRIRNINDSKKLRRTKFTLVVLNVLLGIIAIFVAIYIQSV